MVRRADRDTRGDGDDDLGPDPGFGSAPWRARRSAGPGPDARGGAQDPGGSPVRRERGTMTLYRIALFVHVVGALLLFATLTVEGIGLRSLRRATTVDQARDGSSVARLTRVVGPVSALAIL